MITVLIGLSGLAGYLAHELVAVRTLIFSPTQNLTKLGAMIFGLIVVPATAAIVFAFTAIFIVPAPGYLLDEEWGIVELAVNNPGAVGRGFFFGIGFIHLISSIADNAKKRHNGGDKANLNSVVTRGVASFGQTLRFVLDRYFDRS